MCCKSWLPLVPRGYRIIDARLRSEIEKRGVSEKREFGDMVILALNPELMQSRERSWEGIVMVAKKKKTGKVPTGDLTVPDVDSRTLIMEAKRSSHTEVTRIRDFTSRLQACIPPVERQCASLRCACGPLISVPLCPEV